MKQFTQYFRKAFLCGLLCVFCSGMLSGCTKREPLMLEEFPKESLVGEPVPEEAPAGGNGAETEEPEETVLKEIYVHICGAVNTPGVFALPEGSRVFQAVEAAGGFTEDASPDYINRAQVITDGCKIRIPTAEEVQAMARQQEETDGTEFLIQQNDASAIGHAGEGTDGKININEADAALLCTISGIGEARAAAIIKYREAHGGYQSIEEIMQVDGIKQGTFEKIKDQISVK